MRDLPDYLWVHACNQLEFKSIAIQFDGQEAQGLAALASLCRASSRFLRLARPILYRSLPATTWKIQELLLPTLHQHPHIAKYVENIDLGEGVFTRDEFASLVLPYYEAHSPPTPRSEEIKARLSGFRTGPEWPEDASDIWFAHCIALLPNLKTLELSTRNNNVLLLSVIRHAVAEEAAERAAGGQDSHPGTGETTLPEQSQSGIPSTLASPVQWPSKPLSKLEEFRVNMQDTESAVRLRHIQELFLLPRIRTFRGFAVDLDTTLSSTAGHFPRPSSSLSHLHLSYSLAEAAGIRDLLFTCPGLRTLDICWGPSTVGDSHLDFDQIGGVLREHGTGLDVLDLDCRESFWYEEGEATGKVGSLRALQCLRRLSLPLDILLGSEDELSGLDKVGYEDDNSAASDDDTKGDPVSKTSLETLLPDSLESLRLFSGYDEKTWVQNSVQGVLSSTRLTRLRNVQLDGAVGIGLELDKTGWKSRSRSGHRIFLR